MAGDEVSGVSATIGITVTTDMLMVGLSSYFDGNTVYWNDGDGTEVTSIEGAGANFSVWFESGAGVAMNVDIHVDDNSTDFGATHFVLQDVSTAAPATVRFNKMLMGVGR